MTALDATGLFALEEVARQLQATGRTLILCGAREQPSKVIHQADFEDVIGPANICENVQEALRWAGNRIAGSGRRPFLSSHGACNLSCDDGRSVDRDASLSLSKTI
jgi:hypothetical protein